MCRQLETKVLKELCELLHKNTLMDHIKRILPPPR